MDVHELVAGARRLALGIDEIAARVERYGAVDATDPGEDGERVVLRPSRRRLRPLRSPAQITEVLTRADQAAVHLAGRVRIEPAFDGEQHGLVEVGQPSPRLARVDQYPSDRLKRLGLEIRRTKPAPEAHRVGREQLRQIELAASV